MNEANHEHPLELLSAYLDDELPVDRRAPIDRHLALCPVCRDHLAALRRLSRAVAEEAVPPPPDDLEAKVLRRIDAATVAPMRRRRFVVPASIAATIAAVALVAVVTWRQGGDALVPRVEHDTEQVAGSPLREKARADAPATAEQTAPPVAPPPAATIAKEKRNEVALDKGADNLAKSDQGVQRLTESKDEKVADAIGRAAGGAPAAAAAAPEAMSALKASVVVCLDAADDSAVESSWEVADPAVAVRDLEALAVTLGGRLQRPGFASAETFTVVLPRARYDEFVSAAGGMGITGLEGHRAGAGSACIRQRVAIRQADPR